MRKKIILLLLLLTLTTVSIACNQDAKDNSSQSKLENYKSYFSEGTKLLESEDYELAIEKLTLALGETDHEPTLLNLAKAHYALEEYDEAKNYILVSVDNMTADTSEEHRIYGDVLFALGDLFLALDQYALATQLDEENAYAWYGTGIFFESVKEHYTHFASFAEYVDYYDACEIAPSSSIESFERALEYGDDILFSIHLMDAYIDNNDQLSFIEIMPNLYAQYPNNFNISKKYGQYLDLQHKKDDALAHYKTMAVEFDHPEALILVPQYLYDTAQYQACIEFMEANDPYNQSQSFLELYASAHFAFDRSNAVADEMIKQKPDDYLGYFLKGKFLSSILEYSTSLEYFEKALELKNDYEIKTYLLASLYKSDSIEGFQKLAYEVIDEYGYGYAYHSYYELDLIDSHILLGQYDKAAKLNIRMYNFYDDSIIEEAFVYYNLENYKAALAYIKVALEFEPENNTIEEFKLFLNTSIQLDQIDQAFKLISNIDTSNRDWSSLSNSIDALTSTEEIISAMDQWFETNF